MRKRQIVLYVFVMLVLLTTSVYATLRAELNFKIEASNGNVFYAGDEFTMTIGLKNVDTSQGIKCIEGYIDIDENIFEDLTLSSIVTNANNKIQIGNNELQVFDARDISSSTDKGIIFNTEPVSGRGDYKLVINLENPITSNEDLVTLKFKIKDNVTPGSYASVMAYKLFNVFSTDAGEKLELEQQTYRIDISDRAAVANNTVNNNTTDNGTNNVINNVANNTVGNTVNNVTANNTVRNNVANNTVRNNTVNNAAKNNTVNNAAKNNTVNNTAKNNTIKNTSNKVNNTGAKAQSGNKVDNTISPNNLPRTGYRLILIPIIAMAIIGLVFYKKYSKYNSFHE